MVARLLSIGSRTKRNKNYFLILASFIFLLNSSKIFAASVPQTINFQGRLTDSVNNPRTGTFNFTFKFFDALSAGNQLPNGASWSETQSLTVTNGVFNAVIGSVTPIPVVVFSTNSAVYLEITIGAETLSPRETLAATPFAFNTQTLSGMAFDAFVDTSTNQTINGVKTFTSFPTKSGSTTPMNPGDFATKSYVDNSGGSNNYILNQSTVQAGAVFSVSSGSISGPFTVGGTITAGSAANVITTAAGLVDATKLTNLVPNTSIDVSSITKQGNAFNGANQLVRLDNSGFLPAVDGSALTDLTPTAIADGRLGTNVIASSIAVNSVYPGAVMQNAYPAITGIGTQIQSLNMSGHSVTGVSAPTLASDAATKAYVDAATGTINTSALLKSTNTWTAPQTYTSSVTLVGVNFGVTGSGVISGNGSGMTSLTPGNISAGSLPTSVIATSVAVNAVYPNAVTSGVYGNVTGIGTQGQALNMNSHLINNLSTPVSATDAVTKAYVDAATATVTGNAILNQSTLQAGATFYVSSGTVAGTLTTVKLQVGNVAPPSAAEISGSYPGTGLMTYQNTASSGYSSFDVLGDTGSLTMSFGHANGGASYFPGLDYINSNDGSPIVFNTLYGEVLRITGGLVGIGTATPGAILDVNGNAQFGSVAKSTFSTTGALTMASNTNITLSGTGKVTGLSVPTSASDAVTKAYVDAATASINTSALLNSTNTWTAPQTYASSLTIVNVNLGVTGSGVISGNGSGITSLMPGNISAGSLSSTVIASSIAVNAVYPNAVSSNIYPNITGVGTQGQALNMNSHLINNVTTPVSGTDAATKAYVDTATGSINTSALLNSTNTWTAPQTHTSSVTLVNVNFGVTGSGVISGNGSGITSLTPGNISAGSLPSTVIASSIAVNAVYPNAVSSNVYPNITGVGTQGQALNMSSHLINNVSTPISGTDAATKAYVDTATGTLNNALLTSSNTWTGTQTFASSVTVTTNFGVTGTGVISGNGSGITSLTPGNISAGSLPTSVIASSIAVNAVYPAAITSAVYSNITGVGTQAQALNMNSNLINNLSTPLSATDAATKAYVDLATSTVTGKAILNQNTLQAGATFYVSSGTVVSLTAGGNNYPTVPGSSGQFLQSNGLGGLSWQSVASGGTPAFAVNRDLIQVSSPTSIIKFNGNDFNAALLGSATAYISLNPATTDFVQNTNSLQSNTTFYVSSGTVNGAFRVGGAITAGSGNNLITTAAGLLDATKLTNLVPNSSIDASSITQQGNTFNAANKLVQLNASTQLPAISGALLTTLTPANISAGSLPSTVIASSIAVNAVYPAVVSSGGYNGIIGIGAQTQALNMNSNQINGVTTPTIGTDAANKSYVDTATGSINTSALLNSTNTWTAPQTHTSSVTLLNVNLGVTGSGVISGNGSGVTSLTPANISAGSLPSTVIASSIAVNAVYPNAVSSNIYPNITGIGTQGQALNMNSHLINNVTTPVSAADAATKAYVDTATGTLNGALLSSPNTWTGTQTYTSSVTVVNVNLGVTGSGVISGNGSGITSLTPANISAGSLPSTVIASSIAVNAVYPNAVASNIYPNITGVGTQGQALNMNSHLINNVTTPVAATDAATKGYVDTATASINTSALLNSTNTWTAPQTHTSSVTLVNVNFGVTGSGVLSGNGSGLTSLTPTNISAGSLPSTVVISSIAVNAVYPNAVSSNIYPNITGVGTQGQALNMSSHLINNVSTPVSGTDAATKAYVDTATGTLNSTLLSSANTWTGTQTYTSSVTVVNVNLGVTGSGVISGNGSGITSLTPANISAGSLPSTVIASSIAVNAVYPNAVSSNIYPNITGVGTQGQALNMSSHLINNVSTPVSGTDAATKAYVDTATGTLNSALLTSSNTWTGAQTFASSVTITNVNFGVTGSGVISGNGSGITSLMPGNISAGSLSSTVIASSIAVNAVYPNAVSSNIYPNITGVGTQGQALNMSSHLINNVTTPVSGTDAATKAYVDTATGSINTSALLNSTNTWTAPQTHTSSVTLVNVNLGVTGSGVISGNGSGITSLTPGNISAGSLPSTVIASSIAVNAVYPNAVTSAAYGNITGIGTQTQALNMNSHLINNVTTPVSGTDAATKAYVDTATGTLSSALLTSSNTWTGTQTFASSVTITNVNLGVTGSGVISGNGSGITSLTPGNISAGSLPSTVIASSIAVNAVYPNAVSSNVYPNITGVGTQGQALNMNSHLINNVTTPVSGTDAATKAYVDTATGTLNSVLLTSSNTWTGTQTFTSSVTITNVNLGVSGSGVISGNGSGITSLTPGNISAGSLPTSVIASSIAVNAVYPAAITSAVYSNITGVGTQAQALNMNSNLINNLSTPLSATDAATKAYVDLATSTVTGKAILNQNTLQAGATFYVSSGTVVSLTAGGNNYPTVPGSSGQFLQSNGLGGLSWQSVASGGTPAFAVSRDLVQISSPTAIIKFNGNDFNAALQGSATAFISLNPATTDFIQNTNTLQLGATFYVSSGTVNALTVGTSIIVPASSIAANAIASGSLGSGVIASSISVNAVYPNAVSSNIYPNITGVGTQGQALNMNSHLINNVTTPVSGTDAATKAYVDTATGSINTSALLNSTNTWTAPQTHTSSVTLVNVNFGVTGSGVLSGNGSGLTSLTPGNISAGSLPSTVIASSIAVNAVYPNAVSSNIYPNITGVGTQGQALNMNSHLINNVTTPVSGTDAATKAYVDTATGTLNSALLTSSNTWTGTQTFASSVTVTTNFGVTGSGVLSGNGSGLTSLTPGNISAGSLPSTVITSSIAVNAVYPNAVSSNIYPNITGVGTQGQALNMNSHLINNVTTPVSATDAATKAYVDTATGTLNSALLTSSNTWTGTQTFASSVTVTTNFGVTGSGVLSGNGSGLTNLTPGNISAGLLPSTVIASSIAVNAVYPNAVSSNIYPNITGVGTQGQALNMNSHLINNVTTPVSGTDAATKAYVDTATGTLNSALLTSSNTWTGTQTFASSVTVTTNFGVTGSGVLSGNGSGLTNLTPGNISAGSLPSTVIASSIAVNAVYPNAVSSNIYPNITGVGTQGQALNMNSHLINNVTTPVSSTDAANKSYVDTATGSINTSALLNSTNTWTAPQTHTSSVTLVNVNFGVTGSGVLSGNGSGLTSLTPGNISAGSLPSTVIVSSIAVNAVYPNAVSSNIYPNITGVGTQGQALNMNSHLINNVTTPVSGTDAATKAYVDTATGTLNSALLTSSNTWTGTQTFASSVTVTTNFGVTGSGVLSGNGSGLTSLTPGNISAGSLPSTVITSSIAVNAVYPNAVSSNIYPNITGVGTQGQALNMNSHLINNVTTPVSGTDAATKAYVDTATGTLNSALLTSSNTWTGTQTFASSVTVTTNFGVTGTGVLSGNGSGLTNLTPGNISAGLLPSTVIASSIAVNAVYPNAVSSNIYPNITGVGTQGQALNMNSHLINNVTTPVSATDAATKAYVDTATGTLNSALLTSSNTWTGTQTFASSVTVTTNFGVTGSGVLSGNGSGLTSLTPGNISAGLLPSTVIASSIAVNAVYPNAVSSNIYPNITGVGTQGQALNMNSHLINNVTTPVSGTDAATKAYVDLATATLNGSAILNQSTFQTGAIFNVSSGTIVSSFTAGGNLYPVGNGSTGQFLQTNGLGQLSWQTPASGGGVPSLAVYRDQVQISSPTGVIKFNGNDFNAGLLGAATAFISLNPATTDFIQNTTALQSGAVFNVSSATVSGQFSVSGVVIAGSGNNQITTSAGLLDATKLTNTIPNSSLDVTSVTKQGNIFNIANQLVQLNSSTQLPAVSGALLTSLTPGNLSAGLLPSTVIASSIAVNAVYPNAVSSNIYPNITGVGTQGQALNMNSHLINNVTTPVSGTDAATKAYVDTATGSINTSALLNSTNTWTAPQTHTSSVTLVNVNFGVTGSGVLSGNGSGLTSLTPGNISAGSLPSTVIASSIAVNAVYPNAVSSNIYPNITGVGTQGQALNMNSHLINNVTTPVSGTDAATKAYVDTATGTLNSALLTSSNTWTGTQTFASSVTVTNVNFAVTGSGVLSGNGSGLTSLTPGNISAGLLPSTVIASSIAVNAVYPNAVSSNIYPNITGIGTQGQSLNMNSHLINNVTTPVSGTDAATKAYVDTATGTLNSALLTSSNTWTGTQTFASSVTVANVNFGVTGSGVLSGNGSGLTNLTPGNISAGSLSSTVIVSSIAVNAVYPNAVSSNIYPNITGVGTQGQALNMNSHLINNVTTPVSGTDAATKAYVDTATGTLNSALLTSSNTWTGTQTFASSVTVTTNFGVTGSGVLSGNGSGLTSLTPGNISAGSLPSTVIASSIAVNAVYPNAVSSNIYPNITGVGTQGQALNMNSHLINNVTTPVSATDAANKSYVDTATGSINTSALLNSTNTWTAPQTHTSSVTLVNVNFGVTGSGVLSGNGSGLTSLTPGNISAGSLPSTVIASSIAVNAVYPNAVSSNIYPNITGVGTQGQALNMNSHLINNVTTPVSGTDAATKAYVDTATGTLNSALLTSSNTWTGTQTFASSVTVTNVNFAVTGSGVLSGNGSGLTSLTPGNISAGLLPSTVIASSIAVNAVYPNAVSSNIYPNITGVGTQGQALNMNSHLINNVTTPVSGTDAATKAYVDTATGTLNSTLLTSSNTWTGTQTFASSVTVTTNFGVTGSGVLSGNGSGLTSLTPGNISAGLLPSTVIASSIAVNAVYPNAVSSNIYPNITGVGTQGQALNMNSHLINNVTTPVSATDAANKSYVDTATGSINTSALLNSTNTWTAPQTHTSSVTLVNVNFGVTGSGVLSGNGSGLTSLTPGNISAGSLPSTVIVSSIAVNAVYPNAVSSNIYPNITGVGTQGQALNMNSHLINNVTTPVSGTDAATKAYVDTATGTLNSALLTSSNTWTGTQTFASSVTVTTNFGVTGTGVLSGNGSGLTSLTPGNISAGSLPSTVIASSIAVNAVYPNTVSSNIYPNITGVGTQGQALNMNSHLINNVTNPVSAADAATKAYVDAATSTVTSNAILNQNTLQTGAAFYVSSGSIAGQANLRGSVTVSSNVYISSNTVGFDEYNNGSVSGGITINWNNSNKQLITLSGNVTSVTFTNPPHACNVVLRVNTGSGGNSISSWPASLKWSGGSVPTITTTSGKNDILAFYFDGSTYYGVDSPNF